MNRLASPSKTRSIGLFHPRTEKCKKVVKSMSLWVRLFDSYQHPCRVTGAMESRSGMANVSQICGSLRYWYALAGVVVVFCVGANTGWPLTPADLKKRKRICFSDLSQMQDIYCEGLKLSKKLMKEKQFSLFCNVCLSSHRLLLVIISILRAVELCWSGQDIAKEA